MRPTLNHSKSITNNCAFVKFNVIPETPVPSILSIFQLDCGIGVSVVVFLNTTDIVEELVSYWKKSPFELSKYPILVVIPDVFSNF